MFWGSCQEPYAVVRRHHQLLLSALLPAPPEHSMPSSVFKRAVVCRGRSRHPGSSHSAEAPETRARVSCKPHGSHSSRLVDTWNARNPFPNLLLKLPGKSSACTSPPLPASLEKGAACVHSPHHIHHGITPSAGEVVISRKGLGSNFTPPTPWHPGDLVNWCLYCMSQPVTVGMNIQTWLCSFQVPEIFLQCCSKPPQGSSSPTGCFFLRTIVKYISFSPQDDAA